MKLKRLDNITRVERDKEAEQEAKFDEEFDKAIEKIQDLHKETMKKYEDQLKALEESEDATLSARQAIEIERRLREESLKRRFEIERRRLEREKAEKLNRIRKKTDLTIREIQNQFKAYAAFLPAIPPVLIGIVVFVSRRLREREGVSRERLK